jgi:hypothetical protein
MWKKVFENAANKANDVFNAADAAASGNPGQLIAEGTLGVLDGSETGDILQREAGDLVDAGIDWAQGEDVSLEYDPSVMEEFGTSIPNDGEEYIETISELGC